MKVDRPTESELQPLLQALLSHLDDQQRQQRLQQLAAVSYAQVINNQSDLLSGLWLLREEQNPVAAIWTQRTAGRTAILGHPVRLLAAPGEQNWSTRPLTADDPAFEPLAQTTCQWLDQSSVVMTQLVIDPDEIPHAHRWQAHGFAHLVDLLYLMQKVDPQSSSVPATVEIENVSPIDQPQRWVQLLEATYEQTMDCPELNGKRQTLDTLEGYRETATFVPEGWWIGQVDQQDCGCLIVADHPESDVLELVYIGIHPDFRGRGLGQQFLQKLLFFSANHQRAHVLAAVDKRNLPALKLYRRLGFSLITERSVWARFHP